MKNQKDYSTIDEYVELFDAVVRKRLSALRKAIRRTAPDATERIAYRMPTFFLQGNLVHFAAHAEHIGFYPTPSGIEKFRRELSEFETSRGAIQFPNDKPLPIDLIKRIVKFRADENRSKR
jgi:uncharacterized protein YdhG (YjbR/CyaY superfamily)